MTGRKEPGDHGKEPLDVSVAEGFRFAAVGDCIISRPLTQLMQRDETSALPLELLRGADVTFANLETSILDVRDTSAHPHGFQGDMTVLGVPAVAADLHEMGVDLVGRANNHSMDWGTGGLRETGAWLDEAGLVYAGAGETLAAARAPRYLDTPGGRVGLVSMTTTPGSDVAPALDPFGEVPGRPGVNTIRVRAAISVPPEGIAALNAIRTTLPEVDWSWFQGPLAPVRDAWDMRDVRFEPGEGYGARFDAEEVDIVANLKAVHLASKHADLCVAAIHAHQGDHDPANPPEYLRSLARRLVDAGAGVVVISGPHRLAPIEVHAGALIFYGLSNFIWSDIQEPLQGYYYELSRAFLHERMEEPSEATDADINELMAADGFDDERVYQAVLPVVEFGAGGVRRVEVHAIETGFTQPLMRRGIPRAAAGEAAGTILKGLAEISEPLGTRMNVGGTPAVAEVVIDNQGGTT